MDNLWPNSKGGNESDQSTQIYQQFFQNHLKPTGLKLYLIQNYILIFMHMYDLKPQIYMVCVINHNNLASSTCLSKTGLFKDKTGQEIFSPYKYISLVISTQCICSDCIFQTAISLFQMETSTKTCLLNEYYILKYLYSINIILLIAVMIFHQKLVQLNEQHKVYKWASYERVNITLRLLKTKLSLEYYWQFKFTILIFVLKLMMQHLWKLAQICQKRTCSLKKYKKVVHILQHKCKELSINCEDGNNHLETQSGCENADSKLLQTFSTCIFFYC
ncbi:unnamed protein product [Paramecium octaurelia]|uniref:Transmembrane protein n=1 Tax=Paramecium octaurelia TaxID=43137 RepID=A0A8S1XU19_PAROT|nr:unnamed protein product [Paramecium octaurelia]